MVFTPKIKLPPALPKVAEFFLAHNKSSFSLCAAPLPHGSHMKYGLISAGLIPRCLRQRYFISRIHAPIFMWHLHRESNGWHIWFCSSVDLLNAFKAAQHGDGANDFFIIMPTWMVWFCGKTCDWLFHVVGWGYVKQQWELQLTVPLITACGQVAWG